MFVCLLRKSCASRKILKIKKKERNRECTLGLVLNWVDFISPGEDMNEHPTPQLNKEKKKKRKIEKKRE